jgi:2-oxoglutarate dehydrogenase E2 component (dihydrolipoamide succinyltransferase)
MAAGRLTSCKHRENEETLEMTLELRVPSMGESITEVEIGEWLKAEGDWVDRDAAVVTIESDKASIEVSAPSSGKVAKVLKKTGEKATVGEVIGYLDDGAALAGPQQPAAAERGAAVATEPPPSRAPAAEKPPPPPAAPPRRATASPRQAQESTAARGRERREEVVPMSPLRRKIAERLVAAQSQAALLTTFNEVDMSAVSDLRRRLQDAFLQKHGVKLGLMSFFVKAAVDALRAFPQLNAEVRGTDVVYRSYFDIGVAVGGGKGLVVPVLRDADLMSFAEVEKAIADFARRAQKNEISIEDLAGGTFTISNGGVYGSLLSTPIVNPPQSGILGLHRIEERPVARGGEVVIRPMMYVALTYDHRIVDGREAVGFLVRVKEAVEEPARMLVEA